MSVSAVLSSISPSAIVRPTAAPKPSSSQQNQHKPLSSPSASGPKSGKVNLVA
jgi:hypothetical protein